MLAHGVNHHGGYVWPRGKLSWQGFAAHMGAAWVADTEQARWSDLPIPDDFSAWPSEPPLSPEEEEESGLLW